MAHRDLFTGDAVANYPAGTYVGHDSIRKHLFMNVGGGQVGENGVLQFVRRVSGQHAH